MDSYRDINWEAIDQISNGDHMQIYDMSLDGSHKKFKCRMVLRGKRYKKLTNDSRYASSVDTNGLCLFLSFVACENLKM